MSNLKMLKIVNVVMFFDVLCVVIAMTLYKLSPIEALRGNETVLEIHGTCGMIFVGLAIIHIYLNFNWIKSQIFGIKPVSKNAAKKK